MSTSRLLVRAAHILGIGVIAVVSTIGVLAAAPVAEAAPSTAPAVFTGCLAQQHEGDLLVLMDESKSLQGTDQENQRVPAAQELIKQLTSSAAANDLSIDVAVARFSDAYDRTMPWTRLDRGGARLVSDELETYNKRVEGVQTDYWKGLQGARKELAERAGKTRRCQALVWFSDGVFDVELDREQWRDFPDARHKSYAEDADLRDPDAADAAETAALKDICRPGGVADQLRRNRVTLFAVGLGGSEEDFAAMRGIATGSKVAGDPCGSRTDPTPGSFTRAENIDALLFTFRTLLTKVDDTPICRSTDLATCPRRTFVLDNSLTSVRIDAYTGVQGVKVYLVPPKGDDIELTPDGDASLAPKGSRYSWTGDSTLQITLVNKNRAATPWTGVWSMVFVNPAASDGQQARSSLTVSGGLTGAWPTTGRPEVRIGEKVELGLQLADEAGHRVRSAELRGTGQLQVELRAASGAVLADQTINAREVDETPVPIDLSAATAGPATLTLTLAITTARSGKTPGTALTPSVTEYDITVLAPLGVPQIVSPARLDFGSSTGPVDTTATLRVRGPGCVWRDPGAGVELQTDPGGQGQVSLTSASDSAGTCLRPAEGEEQDLVLRLTTENAATGTLAGIVPVTLSPLDHPDQSTVTQVEFTADLTKPLQTTNFLLTLLTGLILGPGIPIGLLALAKYATAKIPGRAMVAASVPVLVENGEVLRDGVPLALRGTDLRTMVSLAEHGSRRVTAGALTLTTHFGRSPFGVGHVLAESPGTIALSSTDPAPTGHTQAARLPLAVHNTWVAWKSPQDPSGAATVVFLVAADAPSETVTRLVDDVRHRLPSLLPRLEPSTAAASGTASASDPFAAATVASTDQPSYFGDAGSTSYTEAPAPPPPSSSKASEDATAAPAATTPADESPPFSFDFYDDDPGRRP